MIILYSQSNCSDSERIRQYFGELELVFTEIALPNSVHNSLIQNMDGLHNLPFILDKKKKRTIHEVAEIIQYLSITYAK